MYKTVGLAEMPIFAVRRSYSNLKGFNVFLSEAQQFAFFGENHAKRQIR